MDSYPHTQQVHTRQVPNARKLIKALENVEGLDGKFRIEVHLSKLFYSCATTDSCPPLDVQMLHNVYNIRSNTKIDMVSSIGIPLHVAGCC